MVTVLWMLMGVLLGGLSVALALRGSLVEARSDAARARDALEAERRAGAERLAASRAAAEQLGASFKALCADALEQNNRRFLELADARLAQGTTAAAGALAQREQAFAELVAPIRESLGKVDGQLRRLEEDRRASHGALHEHLRSLGESQERLRGETGALVTALRRPQTRGRWGEMQLRRVVEMAGMTDWCDFSEQVAVADPQRALRPDLVVRMPGDRRVVVDAKAPLHAFLDAYDTTDETRRGQGLAAHARLIRDHVRALSAKSYWAQFGDRTPDFVFLFLPGEHFLNAALEADPTVIEEGVDQSVLIATPTTLIALLRAVSYGWRQEQLTEGAREVATLGRELHDRLGTLAQHVDTLGRRLGSTVEAYNGAVGSLEGRVLVTARRLADHGAVSAGRELPTVSPVGTVTRAVHAPEAATEDRPRRDPPAIDRVAG